VNRKFFVIGQFTRYIRPGDHLIEVADPNTIAAYDLSSHRLVVVKVTGAAPEPINFDLSNLSSVADTIQVVATTTTPGGSIPDWKQHSQILKLSKGSRTLIETHLYPKSVYTFVLQGVLR
jgi:hypothetical protein